MRLQQLSLFDPAWCQRWHGGRHSWRPVHEGGFDARRYRLVQVPEALARRFVQRCALPVNDQKNLRTVQR